MMWLNWSVATINTTLQLFYIYIYIDNNKIIYFFGQKSRKIKLNSWLTFACLDSNYWGVCVFVLRFFFFFGLARICWLFHGEQCIRALFTDLQISLFSNFFIKNEPHDTIHTFKNYFTTVFSVSAKISSIQTNPMSLFG